jgi:hypothetical protein
LLLSHFVKKGNISMGTMEHVKLKELPQHNSLGLVPCSLFLESWSSSLFNVEHK